MPFSILSITTEAIINPIILPNIKVGDYQISRDFVRVLTIGKLFEAN